MITFNKLGKIRLIPNPVQPIALIPHHNLLLPSTSGLLPNRAPFLKLNFIGLRLCNVFQHWKYVLTWVQCDQCLVFFSVQRSESSTCDFKWLNQKEHLRQLRISRPVHCWTVWRRECQCLLPSHFWMVQGMLSFTWLMKYRLNPIRP